VAEVEEAVRILSRGFEIMVRLTPDLRDRYSGLPLCLRLDGRRA